MKTIGETIILSALAIVLAACSPLAPKPIETPVPTQTTLPTSTSTPWPTNMSTPIPVLPTETPSTPVLSIPIGTPASEWGSIPIMPNVIAGEGDSGGYSFTITASVDEIQKFYETELAKLGWNAFASGQGTTDAVMLIFMKNTDVLSVSIVPQPDGIMYVLLVK